MKINQSGKLYVVGTPIGNLNDISYRAVSTLKEVDWIAVEDTRHSKILLSHYNIQKKLISIHNFNEKSRIEQVISLLQSGENGALISDAGTPCISDPGALLMQQLHLNQIPVVPIPGPCALITALSVSGFATTEFLFAGFLPAKSTTRQSKLKTYQALPYTLIFYEAPHRLTEMLSDCKEILGENRRIMVARELTKKYETLYVSDLKNIVADSQANLIEVRGEFVIIIEGLAVDKMQNENLNHEQANKMLTKLIDKLSVKSAVQLTADVTGYPKNKLYDLALTLQSQKQA